VGGRVLCLLLAWATGMGAAQASSGSAGSIVLSLPPGGCTLRLDADGGGALGYGAMPREVRVAPDSFAMPDLRSLLLGMARVQTSDPRPESPAASVAFDGSSLLAWIDDAALVEGLLWRAWQARIVPDSSRAREDLEWVARACRFEPRFRS
jgi:hypothetical protein